LARRSTRATREQQIVDLGLCGRRERGPACAGALPEMMPPSAARICAPKGRRRAAARNGSAQSASNQIMRRVALPAFEASRHRSAIPGRLAGHGAVGAALHLEIEEQAAIADSIDIGFSEPSFWKPRSGRFFRAPAILIA